MRRSIFVNCSPVGKQRPRTVRLNGKVRTFTPKETSACEEAIGSAWEREHGTIEYSGELEVAVEVRKQLPKSYAKRLVGSPWTKKPDIDNLAKTALDALNGIAYDDDSRITRLVATKAPYVSDEAEQGYLITITYKEAHDG